MSKDLNIYDLTRDWWNFCFENPEKIKPVHTAIYMFAIEHCNRLAWKEKFGLPTTMAMEAIGVKSYNTYINAFNNLVDWGFIKLIQKSRNQHSSNIVALSKNDKAHNKALDKAMYKHGTKHTTKQSKSTVQSTVSIDIPITNNHIPITKDISIAKIKNFDEMTNDEILAFNERIKQNLATDSLPTRSTSQRKEKKRKEKERKVKEIRYIPTIEEVILYFQENNYPKDLAEKAYHYYNTSIESTPNAKYWKDAKSNPIKNWKMKMQSVWFKEENRNYNKPGQTDLGFTKIGGTF